MRNEHIVSIDENVCISCGLCVKDCPSGALTMTEQGAKVITQQCIKCAHCVAVCPSNAVSISGFEDEPEELNPDLKVDVEALMAQMKSRRSMRHFTKQDISKEVIAKIIEAGQYTPSGSNKQAVSYVVIKKNIDEYEKIAISLFRQIKKVVDIISSRFKRIEIDDHFLFKGAPVAIVIKSTDVVDGALAASTMELMAQSLGLGVLYSGFFSRAARISRKLKKKLQVKSNEKVVTTLVLGYPAVKYKRSAPKEKPLIQFD